jgi:hypothetical protein
MDNGVRRLFDALLQTTRCILGCSVAPALWNCIRPSGGTGPLSGMHGMQHAACSIYSMPSLERNGRSRWCSRISLCRKQMCFQVWASVIVKAFAKQCSSYEAMHKKGVTSLLQALFGGEVTLILLPSVSFCTRKQKKHSIGLLWPMAQVSPYSISALFSARRGVKFKVAGLASHPWH